MSLDAHVCIVFYRSISLLYIYGFQLPTIATGPQCALISDTPDDSDSVHPDHLTSHYLLGGLYLEIQEHLTLIRSRWISLCLHELASSLCTSIIIQSDGGVRTLAACPSFQPFSHLAYPNRNNQTDPTIFLISHSSDNISATALV